MKLSKKYMWSVVFLFVIVVVIGTADVISALQVKAAFNVDATNVARSVATWTAMAVTSRPK